MKRRIPIEQNAVLFIVILVPLLAGQVRSAQPPSPDQSSANTSPRKTKHDRESRAYNPTSRYDARHVEGWTVLIDKGFLGREPDLADRTLTQLRHQLRQVAARINSGSLTKLRAIHIWVEENEPHHPCMAYHPDAGWLCEHDMNPDKARCVEVANARNFLKWTSDQPWMVLHELAHGYHHQVLDRGFQNAEVKTAFDRASKTRRYESVARIDSKNQKAYAATNPMEYFAEATEAFFGKNDFYPFIRSELKQHDPEMFELLKKLWHDG
jgi:hypothetical protein